MKVWHPRPLKKLKSWVPFWSYQLNYTANSAHLVHFCGKWALKRLPGFWFFSIATDADYSFYVKSIALCASTFFRCIISVLDSVIEFTIYIYYCLSTYHPHENGQEFTNGIFNFGSHILKIRNLRNPRAFYFIIPIFCALENIPFGQN